MTDTLTNSAAATPPSAPVYTVTQERKIVTAIPGPRSTEVHQRRLAAVSTGVSSALPVYIEKASGAIVVDLDGNQFIDLGAGIGVTTVGHSETSVVEIGRAHV